MRNGTESFKRALPSANGLVTFEAAARLKSFTAAAQELGVTQAAVSRQIKVLEEYLGVDLFRRLHRRVEATPQGVVLGDTVSQCLDRIGDTLEAIRPSEKAGAVVIGATVAFSQLWLLPRLSAFRARHPSVQIRVVAQDASPELRTAGVDVLVCYGDPPFAGGRVVASKTDVVFPVCSPGFKADLSPKFALQDLCGLPLIDNDAPEPSWINWPKWFFLAQVDCNAPAIALKCSHYTDSISAAMAGHGVALGWHVLIERLLADRLLVPLFDSVVSAPASYNVVTPLSSRRNPLGESFVAWIQGEFAAVAGGQSLEVAR